MIEIITVFWVLIGIGVWGKVFLRDSDLLLTDSLILLLSCIVVGPFGYFIILAYRNWDRRKNND